MASKIDLHHWMAIKNDPSCCMEFKIISTIGWQLKIISINPSWPQKNGNWKIITIQHQIMNKIAHHHWMLAKLISMAEHYILLNNHDIIIVAHKRLHLLVIGYFTFFLLIVRTYHMQCHFLNVISFSQLYELHHFQMSHNSNLYNAQFQGIKNSPNWTFIFHSSKQGFNFSLRLGSTYLERKLQPIAKYAWILKSLKWHLF